MRIAKRFVAASLIFALPVAQALAAGPVACSGNSSDGTIHKDPGFDFTKGGKVWRATITVPAKIDIANFKSQAAAVQSEIDKPPPNNLKPTCSQYIAVFTGKTDFMVDNKPGQIANVSSWPDCQNAAGTPTTAGPLKGHIEVYCINVGGRIDRYANIIIWNPTNQPYGAAYTVLGAGTDTNGEYRFDGYGSDPVNRAQVAIHFEADKR